MMDRLIPQDVIDMTVLDASDVKAVSEQADFIFCAVVMPKAETRALEEAYAKAETPVVSSNSATRLMGDVPMLMPEINPEHMQVINLQRRRLGTKSGFIVVKPNCSIQSYVGALHPLRAFGLREVSVCTYQAVSGAGRTLASWPEMQDNVIPYIGGEEEKSEQEPLKIWGGFGEDGVKMAAAPIIAAQCVRVPVSDGHLAAVSVRFDEKPSYEEILAAWRSFETLPQQLGLPSAPKPFVKYFEENDRPQTRLDRNEGRGMAVTVGRLREDPIMDWRFIALSHNTLRGAAGGGVLTAELLCKEGWIQPK
jgi:aspartate-semialdehyde dehydrogenase